MEESERGFELHPANAPPTRDVELTPFPEPPYPPRPPIVEQVARYSKWLPVRWFGPKPECRCDAVAVHRPGWQENPTFSGVAVPPGGWPPVATLSLSPGNYVVSAKASLATRTATNVHVVGTLRRLGAPSGPYFDSAWVRLAPQWQPAEQMVMSLHGVVTLTAADLGVVLLIGHSAAINELVAVDVWLSALRVDVASVQTV
jgi:hypothetical protein